MTTLCNGKNDETSMWIDALKGLAMCGVVMTHMKRNMLPEILEKIAVFGSNGVQLFLVISGFLIFSSYKKKIYLQGYG